MPDLEFERIELNAIPDGSMSVFHASQYETMRPFIAYLKWGEAEFAPGEDCWCTLSIRKPDDTLVIIDQMDIDNNEVSCILTQQAVACPGDSFCQLKVWAESGGEDGCIACLNFILHVQPDPEAGGLTSESEINNLTEQIETITQEVIGEDYYNKTEVDTLLAAKADSDSVYTKGETDTLLSAKANTADVYTKTQVDDALALKANSADLATVATTGDYDDLLNKPTIPDAQIQSDWTQADNTKVDYIKNKPDIAAMIESIFPTKTATGAIASFTTALTYSLVSITTSTGATEVIRCGVNLFDDDNLIIASYPYPSMTFDKATYLKAGTYTASISNVANATSWRFGYRFFNADGTIITSAITNGLVSFTAGTAFLDAYDSNQTCLQASDNTETSVKFTLTADCYIVGCISNGNVGATTTLDYQIETGASASNFVEYNGAVYPIAEASTITTFAGVNNVFDDGTGDITVQYKDTTI